MISIFFQAKWKLVDNKLSNQAGVSLTGKWNLEGGNITNIHDTTKGFGVLNDGTAAGSEVDINENLTANDKGQQWIRSPVDSVYFTLMNPNSEKFLSAVTADKISIEGK